MKEVKAFTTKILKELELRMNSCRHPMPSGIEKHMVSLESLLKKKPAGNNAGEATVQAAAQAVSEKKIITEKDLLDLKGVEEFVVSQGDIVTPLAKDLLRKKRIRLIVK